MDYGHPGCMLYIKKNEFTGSIKNTHSGVFVMLFPLRKERNEYAKRIRKDYEAHRITERRVNMYDYNIRPDDISNTITTVEKDTWLLEIKKL